MKIGILQTGHVPEDLARASGEYPDMFAELLAGRGFAFETWAAVDGQFPHGPEAAEGWLVTGSRHGAYEDLPWIAPLEELIRRIVVDQRPLIGVCFGHQIIAQALGGKVEKFAGGWSVGPQEYDMPGGKAVLQAWHQDQVTELPDGAEVVGASDFCAFAALLYPFHAYTVQPHPEFGDTFVHGLIETRGPGIVPDALLQRASKRMGGALDQTRLADQFAHFLRERRLP